MSENTSQPTYDSVKAEIISCLKVGPSGWSELQPTLSAPAKWLVSAARGKRDVRDIAVDFKEKFVWKGKYSLLSDSDDDHDIDDDEHDIVRESIALLRAQQYGLRDWKENLKKPFIDAWPFAELKASRGTPDGWQEKWEDAGGIVENGRCVACKDSDVWKSFSEFGQPYEPFDWKDSFVKEDVSRREGEAFGFFQQPAPTPAKRPPLTNTEGCLLLVVGAILLFFVLGVFGVFAS